MPSFSVQIPNLNQVGPVVEIILTPSVQFQKIIGASSSSKTVKVLAMIDTGATSTVIRDGLATLLGINPVSDCLINTPSSTNHRCLQYDVQIVFPNNVSISSCVVTEAPLQNQHIQCLIGRDILQQCVFIYTGHTNSYTLSF